MTSEIFASVAGARRRVPVTRAAASVVVGVLGLAVTAVQALAQSVPPEARKVYEDRFKASLANPGDLEAAFKFAEAANSVGEYEAAIGALERMLFFNPNLARVRLELGVLYFRLGAYGQSRTYFKSALQQKDVPDDVRATVEKFLAEIDRRERTSQFSGFVQVGARYQTNANAGPANLNVRVLGFDATLDPAFRSRPDWNAFLIGSVRHVLDFDNQRGDTWETVAQTYIAQQATVSTYNIQAVEITSGPRLALPLDALPGASFRPYIIGALLGLSDTYYTSTGGVGAAFSLPVQSVTIEAGGEYRWRDFHNSSVYPTNTLQSGRLGGVFVTVSTPVAAGVRAQVKGALFNNDADAEFNSFTSQALEIALPIEYVPPIFSSQRAWLFTPLIGGAWFNYKAANPIVDPFIKRNDRESHVGLNVEAPVSDLFSLGAQVLWSRNQSNLPNYRYRNFSIAFGPSIRF